jgi:hypothetical protein
MTMNAARNLPPLTPDPSRAVVVYRTEALDLSSAILATGALPYLRTENIGDGRVAFVFSDPERKGPTLEIDYNLSRFATLQPLALFRCKMILQDAMRAALQNGGRYGNGNR